MIVYLLGLIFSVTIILLGGLIITSRNARQALEDELAALQEKNAALTKQEEKLRADLAESNKTLATTFEDPLTGLISWKFFQDRLSQTIKESSRYNFTLGVLYIDLDDFHVVNDALGYEVGDLLLKEAANRLQSCIRQVDSLTRLNKDIFVALLSQLAKPETAALVAQRMLQALNQPFQINDKELYTTACIGVAIFPADGHDAATTVRNAEQALALAKEKDKNMSQFYQEKIHINSRRELFLYTGLRREAIFDEFTLFYQPIVNTQNESIYSMHAQLQWKHPEIGSINENDLYNYAEKQRKLNDVFVWLLEKACKQFMQWKTVGFTPDYLTIPSPAKLLENSHFVPKLSQVLQEINFNPENLILEFYDNVAALDMQKLEKAANMLKYLGVKSSIHNFGSGSFSFCQLKTFPVGFFVIDPRLTFDIEINYQSIALVKSIAFMAKNLAVELVAKDIETVEQMIQLRSLGCNYMQGKMFSTAIADDEVVTKMKHLVLSS